MENIEDNSLTREEQQFVPLSAPRSPPFTAVRTSARRCPAAVRRGLPPAAFSALSAPVPSDKNSPPAPMLVPPLHSEDATADDDDVDLVPVVVATLEFVRVSYNEDTDRTGVKGITKQVRNFDWVESAPFCSLLRRDRRETV